MIRQNTGNIITNGMQILSVGATTGSQVFRNRADSALNNLTRQERKEYGKFKANQMRDEMNEYNTKQANKKPISTLIENSDQMKAINEKIDNDVNFSKQYGIRFYEKATGKMTSINSIIGNQKEEGGNK